MIETFLVGVVIGAVLVHVYQWWEYNRRFPRVPMKDLKRMAQCYGLRAREGESRRSLYERLRRHMQIAGN